MLPKMNLVAETLNVSDTLIIVKVLEHVLNFSILVVPLHLRVGE